jgi:hypothetical protein
MDIKVKDLIRFGSYCPTQWDGETTNGEKVYIRYRWGVLTVDIDGEEVFSAKAGKEFDGIMGDEEMKELTKPIIEW